MFANHADDVGFFLGLARVNPDSLASGVVGTITRGVVPEAVSDGQGGPPPRG